MDRTKMNKQAFPASCDARELGLTKREYFAAMILQGIYASGEKNKNAPEWAVARADLLIKELRRETLD